MSFGQASLGSVYDIFFLQFASIFPDPVERDQKVREFLAANGMNPNTQLVNQVLTNTPVVGRQQLLSYSMTGVRTSLVLSLQRSVTDRLGAANGVIGDLNLFQTVVQRGVSATLSHQLTPMSAAGLSFSMTHSSGLGGSSALGSDMKLRVFTANWSTRLGTRTSVGLMARHAVADGVSSYRENAASATLNQLF